MDEYDIKRKPLICAAYLTLFGNKKNEGGYDGLEI
jgi:hypothetical protein